jgi:hypothetical protein
MVFKRRDAWHGRSPLAILPYADDVAAPGQVDDPHAECTGRAGMVIIADERARTNRLPEK